MNDQVAELRNEIARLHKVIEALMDRVEHSAPLDDNDFATFQRAAQLEVQVARRTAELQASEAKSRALVEQSLVGIATIEDGRFSYANQRFTEIFGYDDKALRRLGPLDLVAPPDRPLVREQLRRRLSGEASRVQYQMRGLTRDGRTIDVEVYGNVADIAGKTLLVSVVQDISDRLRAERALLALQDQLRHESVHDALTGLHNRRYLQEVLDAEIRRAARERAPLALLMCDVDHFKRINDGHGHSAGDAVLRGLGALLKAATRGSDVCCRFGGEEFVLLFPGTTLAAAQSRAEELRQRVAQSAVAFEGRRLAVTASFGVAAYPADGADADALLAAADRALYAAKAAGRDQVASSSSADAVCGPAPLSPA